MQQYFNVGELARAPLVRMFNPFENFSRASPILWIFCISFLLFIVGAYVPFLSLFAWIGGTVFLICVAVAISLFSTS